MSPWTQERIDFVKTKWTEGFSAGWIAREMKCGFTRNAIVGKVCRLGLCGKARGDSGRRNTEIGRSLVRRLTLPRGGNKRKLAPAPIIVETPHPGFLKIPFEKLTDKSCRYPIGDNPFVFCGQPKMEGSSYCAHCHLICWVSPRARQENRNTTRLNSAAIIKLRGTLDPLAVDANISEIEAA